MSEGADVDWATGLSERIRQLASQGASHEMIDRYIDAKRTGDPAAVDARLAELQSQRVDRQCREETPVERALRNIRIAALRPEVNHLTGLSLVRYVLFVLELSAKIVEARSDPLHWESTAVTEAIAAHVRKTALEWIRGSADLHKLGS